MTLPSARFAPCLAAFTAAAVLLASPGCVHLPDVSPNGSTANTTRHASNATVRRSWKADQLAIKGLLTQAAAEYEALLQWADARGNEWVVQLAAQPLAKTYWKLGRREEALRVLADAQQRCTEVAREAARQWIARRGPGDAWKDDKRLERKVENLRRWISDLTSIGLLYAEEMGEYERAYAAFSAAAEIDELSLGGSKESAREHLMLRLARMAARLGRPEETLERLREPAVREGRLLSMHIRSIVQGLEEEGHLGEAASAYELYFASRGDEPSLNGWELLLKKHHAAIASRLGRHAVAAESYRQGFEAHSSRAAESNVWHAVDAAQAQENQAQALRKSGEEDAALAAAKHAVSLFQGLVRREPQARDFPLDLTTGDIVLSSGRVGHTRKRFVPDAPLVQRRGPPVPVYLGNALAGEARSRMLLADLLMETGGKRGALQEYRAAIDRIRSLPIPSYTWMREKSQALTAARTVATLSAELENPADDPMTVFEETERELLRSLAQDYRWLARGKEADEVIRLYQSASDHHYAAGDKRASAVDLRVMADAARYLERLDEALVYERHRLRALEDLSAIAEVVGCATRIAEDELALGRPGEALRMCRHALEYEEDHEPYSKARNNARLLLCRICRSIGGAWAAREAVERHLRMDLMEKSREHYLDELYEVYLALGEWDKARQCCVEMDTNRFYSHGRLQQARDAAAVLSLRLEDWAQAEERFGSIVEPLRHKVAKLDFDANDVARLGWSLVGLGTAQLRQGELDEAAAQAEEALGSFTDADNRAGRVSALSLLADVRRAQGQAEAALSLRYEAAELAAGGGMTEALYGLEHTLSRELAMLGRAELAVCFGKRAVNRLQAMRAGLRGEAPELQDAFVTEHDSVYRGLADLLIAQGRLPEAQQVLRMLKEDEYFEFIRRDAGEGGAGESTVGFNPGEADWKQRYDGAAARIVALAQEARTLRTRDGRDAGETARLRTLDAELDAAREAFYSALNTIHEAPDPSGTVAAKNLYDVEGMQDTLRALGPGTVLLHYVVAGDRVHVILTTPEIQVAREALVPRAELNEKLFALRRALGSPASDPVPAARAVYDLTLAPVAEDLRQANARTLMLSLDGALRYVPFAALHDGEGFVAERYRTVLFTEAAKTSLKDAPLPEWSVSAFGVTQPAEAAFSPLPNVVAELEGIVKRDGEDPDGVWPGSVCMDQAFSAEAFGEQLKGERPVVHVATHFVFHPGTVSDSYLLMGDGGRLSLDEMRRGGMRFRNVELLALSACETGVSERRGEGKEVEGLAVLAQRRGARGVLATLWPVADASTGRFMQTFYRLRRDEPGLSKAEALQRAQAAFLTGASDVDSAGGAPRGIVMDEAPGNAASANGCRHPYFWAPFILMGHWL